jgi:ankyrin repeat domain-containing protein 50
VQSSLLETCEALRLQGSHLDQEKCKEGLRESFNLFSKTTLILDALDECDPASRGKLISFLDSLVAESKNPVKIFIASRPDEDIRNRFSTQPNIEIQATDNHGDIEKYIDAKIPVLSESNLALSTWGDDIKTELLRRCQGM